MASDVLGPVHGARCVNNGRATHKHVLQALLPAACARHDLLTHARISSHHTSVQDITEFQKEKQGALNQIDVVVNLKMHQVGGNC